MNPRLDVILHDHGELDDVPAQRSKAILLFHRFWVGGTAVGVLRIRKRQEEETLSESRLSVCLEIYPTHDTWRWFHTCHSHSLNTIQHYHRNQLPTSREALSLRRNHKVRLSSFQGK